MTTASQLYVSNPLALAGTERIAGDSAAGPTGGMLTGDIAALAIAGRRAIAIVAVDTAAGAVASVDYTYIFTVAGKTLTLPTAVGNTGIYTLKNASAGNINAASTSAQTFDGSASPIVLSPNQSLSFISDGANWRLI